MKVIIAFIGLLALSSWSFRVDSKIEKVKWLMGVWENKTQRGSIYESWTTVNKMEISGKSFVVKEGDTMVFENIRIVEEADNLFYIPIVKNQNEGLPVRFAMTSLTDTNMVFENPAHDFPQKISYTKINADSLVAMISGLRNGQERQQVFPMKRG